MSNGINKSIPWGWIILALILFWPIGLVLLLNKIRTDKSATLRNGRLIALTSYVLFFLSFMYLTRTFTSNIFNIVPAILTLGGGLWINRIAKRMQATGARYRRYIALVVNQSETSIDRIAGITGIPYNTVVRDLQDMITRDYFHDAHVDVARREIVLARPAPIFTPQTPFAPTNPPQARTVTCQSCGANNRFFGPTGVCEYCDSPLQ